MPNKLLPLFAGAIALSLTTAPSIVQAQLGQEQSRQNQRQVKFAGLELTETQKTQLREVHRDTRSQVESVLTPAQRRQLQAVRESGEKQQTGFADINLSQTQKSQIQTILRSAKTRMDDILTPEQRQQVQRNMEQNRQQRYK